MSEVDPLRHNTACIEEVNTNRIAQTAESYATSRIAVEPFERLKQARMAAGFEHASDFAEALRKAGRAVTTEAYRHHENGTRKMKPEVAALYAPYLKVSPEFLLFGGEPPYSGKINHQMRTTRMAPQRGIPEPEQSAIVGTPEDNLLRVLGMAEGGPDGWNLWNGEVVQYITRPDNLKGVPGAYAVFIKGESMIPRYEPGEIAHVHPGKPVMPGSYVLVQRHNPKDETQPLAVVKRLVRRSGSKVTLAQLNPKKEFDLPAAEIVSIHKVVGSSES